MLAINGTRSWHGGCFYQERVRQQITERQVRAMNSQMTFADRRERPRVGVMAQLEDITYSILRKHGVVSGQVREAPAAEPITQ